MHYFILVLVPIRRPKKLALEPPRSQVRDEPLIHLTDVPKSALLSKMETVRDYFCIFHLFPEVLASWKGYWFKLDH